MKTPNAKALTQTLVGNIKLARERVAIAESQFQAARERAKLAKRRRKEIKLIARRARKQAKQAKAALAEATEALTEAEAKLANVGRRSESRGTAHARPFAKAIAAAPRKRAASRRKVTSVSSATSPAPGPAAPGQPAPGLEQPASATTPVVATRDGEPHADPSAATALTQPEAP
jgi:hypothetical protein